MPFKRAAGAIDVGAGYCATLEEIRAVWAAVSAEPAITIRCLVTRTGIKQARLRQILFFLERAGYLQLEHKPGRKGRKVLIPLVGRPINDVY